MAAIRIYLFLAVSVIGFLYSLPNLLGSVIWSEVRDLLLSAMPVVLMGVAFYVLMILLPQKKRARTHDEVLEVLNKGDESAVEEGLINKIDDKKK